MGAITWIGKIKENGLVDRPGHCILEGHRVLIITLFAITCSCQLQNCDTNLAAEEGGYATSCREYGPVGIRVFSVIPRDQYAILSLLQQY
jgi:hypothetical protein